MAARRRTGRDHHPLQRHGRLLRPACGLSVVRRRVDVNAGDRGVGQLPGAADRLTIRSTSSQERRLASESACRG